MLKALYLLPFLLVFSCTRDSFEPLEKEGTLYYLLIKAETGENLHPLKVAAAACFRKHGRYRTTNLYLGQNQEEPVLIVRKFESQREAKSVEKALRKERLFRQRETRIVSQANYRELLRQRTFYAVL